MSLRGFSKTAMLTAICRAAHQVLDDDPKILCDPVALKFIDAPVLAAIRAGDLALMGMANPFTRSHFCLRSRIAEDCMRRAAAFGVEQYVILGAGLDSFAYRQPLWARGGRIVEVDHPETQRLKIELIKAQALGPPQNVAYLAVDFATESLIDRFEQANIDEMKPIFVSWLGVSQYLAADAVSGVLRALAAWRGGCGLLMTYLLADWSELEPAVRAGAERTREWAASVGEPWLSGYSEASMIEALRSAGFATQKPVTMGVVQSLYFANRTDGLKAEGGPTRIIGAHTSESGAPWFDLGCSRGG